jgi:uncharacterized protein (TIGR03435 family)
MTIRFPHLFVLAWGITASLMSPAQNPPPAAKAPLAFEAVSIRPHDPAQPWVQFQYLPSGFHVEGALTTVLLMQAFQIRLWDIAGAPSWFDDERFDATAKADHPVSREETREMMRTLLADRFHLQFHHEMRPATLYALMVDKPGKLQRSADQTGMGTIRGLGRLKFQGAKTSMPELCQFIGNWTQLRVIDKTGLDGFYDFTLGFIPPEGLYGLPPGVEKPDYPDIFHALKEQLGLKLEQQKGEADMFVIDHIEKPTAN